MMMTLSRDSFGTAQAVDLRTEYQREPLAVDEARPRLSWILQAEEQSFKQAAFQILVASNRGQLDQDGGDLWDSGRVAGDANSTEYGGHSLASGAAIFWKVRIWDCKGMISKWSEVATWGMGLLHPADWKAEWIRLEATYSREESPSPWFRKTFEVKSRPLRAIAYVGSAGYHELYVNGRKVDEAVLTPAVSDLTQRTLYVAYDIAPFLEVGSNCVGVWAGRGWFIEVADAPPMKVPGPRVRALCRIESEGAILEIGTDASWRSSASSVTTVGEWHFAKFGGERYDASLENPEWANAGYDDSGWDRAQVAPSPAPVAVAQSCPRNRIGKRLPAVACEGLPDGKFRLDFGTDLTGWLRLKIPAMEEGRSITLRYADSLGEPKGSYNEADYYISSGKAGEFCSRFGYHGFRTVTVEGLSAPPELADAEAMLVESDLEPGGTFECSNALLNRIHEMQVWTFRCLDLGGQSVDCPHRERLGYGAEGQVASDSAICNFWMPGFYTKWLQDWRLAQDAVTGSIPNTAPYRWGGGGPGYGGVLSVMTWQMYLYYGDTQLVRDNYESMQRYLDWLGTHCEGEILQRYGGSKWDFLGDWLAPGRGMDDDGKNWAPLLAVSFFNSCYRIYLWQIQLEAAAVLGCEEDVVRCREKIATIRQLVHRAFYQPEQQIYVLNEQSYLMIPLLVGVVPEEHQEAVLRRLVERIAGDCKGHVETGVLGTWFLIRYLMEIGRDDLLFDMASRETYPGWGYMLAQGATTCWEQWEGDNWSHIHSSFISLDSWFYQGIGGIRPAEPGFRKIVIKPALIGDLTWARTTYRSIHGDIASNWSKVDGRFVLEVRIPANTSAIIHMPGGDEVIEIGSGSYRFESLLKA